MTFEHNQFQTMECQGGSQRNTCFLNCSLTSYLSLAKHTHKLGDKDAHWCRPKSTEPCPLEWKVHLFGKGRRSSICTTPLIFIPKGLWLIPRWERIWFNAFIISFVCFNMIEINEIFKKNIYCEGIT